MLAVFPDGICGRVVEVIKSPTQKDVLEYGRASVRASDSLRQQEIRLALKAGFQLSLADITTEEFAVLRVLQLERDRWQQERERSDQAPSRTFDQEGLVLSCVPPHTDSEEGNVP